MAIKNFKESTNVSDKYSRKLIRGNVTATAGIRNPDTLNMVYGVGANRIEMLRILEKQSKFNLIWYITFFLFGIVCMILEPASWYLVLDLYIVMVNIDLVSKGKLSGVYIGVAECFLYAFICYQSNLFGEIIKMFVINIPLNIVTIISWTKNLKQQKKQNYSQSGQEETEVVIRKLSKKSWLWITPVFLVLCVGCYFGLDLLGTSALIFSTGALACTIFNKILNGLRYKESWIFSIASNLISVAMWVEVIIVASKSGLDLMELPALVTAIACLTNSFYGYSLWKSMYRKVAINGGEVLAIRKVNIKKIIKLRHVFQKMYWNKNIDTNKNS